MELDKDWFAIEGALISAHKTTGDFTRINFLGGNEEKINHVIDLVTSSITTIQSTNETALENIVYCLLLNTDFKHKDQLQSDDNIHLIDVIPSLSPCLFVNMIIKLDLNAYLSAHFEKLPLSILEDLLQQFVINFAHYDLDIVLKYALMYIESTIKRFNTLGPDEDNQVISNIPDALIELINTTSGINPDKVLNWDANKLYLHMGNSLFGLLKLLMCCNVETNYLEKITQKLINTSIQVVKAVTMDVYCVWAEDCSRSDSLQLLIAQEAYFVSEKYKENDNAKELIQMLSSIAQKPKPLNVLIFEADLATIIAYIHKADENQIRWLQTLLIHVDLLKNNESLACLRKWFHLCTTSDITRLFGYAVRGTDQDKEIVVELVSNLSSDDLILAITQFFYSQGICHSFISDEKLTEQLVLLMNQILPDDACKQQFIKTICLLLLQKPKLLISELYTGFLKNAVFSKCLQESFQHIRHAVQAENLARNTYVECYKANTPNSQNITKHKVLLISLIEARHINFDKICIHLFVPLLEEYLQADNFPKINYLLQLITSMKTYLTFESKGMISILLQILQKPRNLFFNFSPNSHGVLGGTMKLLELYNSIGVQTDPEILELFKPYNDTSKLNMFFIKSLRNEVEDDILKYVFTDFNVKNHSKAVAQLMTILPRCTTLEWKKVAVSLLNTCSYKRSIAVLNDTVLILCDVKKRRNLVTVPGLKYTLQNYGRVIRDIIRPNEKPTHIQQYLIKLLVILLIAIPAEVKQQEGLKLASILPKDGLKKLATDKKFVCSIMAIKNNSIMQALAHEML